jgi:hypothetical protein
MAEDNIESERKFLLNSGKAFTFCLEGIQKLTPERKEISLR